MTRIDEFSKWLRIRKKFKNKKAKKIISAFEYMEVAIEEIKQVSFLSFVNKEEVKSLVESVKSEYIEDAVQSDLFYRNIENYLSFLDTVPIYATLTNQNNIVKEESIEKEKVPDVAHPVENTENGDNNVLEISSEDKSLTNPLQEKLLLIKETIDEKINIKSSQYEINYNSNDRKEIVKALGIDLVNNSFINLEKDVSINDASSCFRVVNDDELYIVDGKTEVADKAEYSLSSVFNLSNPIEKNYAYDAIGVIVKDYVNSFKIGCKHLIYFIPDALDEFQKKLRQKMYVPGMKSFPVPRSIAAMVYLQNTLGLNAAETEYTIVDLDGKESSTVKLFSKNDKRYSRKIFVRKNILKTNMDINYNTFCLTYLKKIEDKYLTEISDEKKSMLISSNRMRKLFEYKEPIIICDKYQPIRISFDSQIYDEIKKEYELLINKYVKDNKLTNNTRIIFSVIADTQNQYLSFKDIMLSFISLNNWLVNREPLWEEYLPELKLQIINEHGAPDFISLIGKEKRVYISDSSTGDEEITFSVDKILTLNASEAEKTELPLIKDAQSKLNSNKTACFNHGIIEEPVKVKLEVSYHYGDEDSIQIVAREVECLDNTNEKKLILKNEWEDTDELPNDKYPEFLAEQNLLSPNEVAYVSNGLKNIADSVNSFYNFDKLEQLEYYEKKDNRIAKLKLYNTISINTYKKFTNKENLNIDEVKNVLIRFKKTIYMDLIKLVIDKERSELYQRLELRCDKSVLQQFVRDTLFFVCNSGCLINRELIDYLMSEKDIQNLIYASRTIDNNDLGIFDIIAEGLRDSADEYIRTISAVCWQNKNWIVNLYHADKHVVDVLIDVIYDYLINFPDSKIKTGNLVIIRDVLEVLLSISRLKEFDESILDCNDVKTKELVVRIIEINNLISERFDYNMYEVEASVRSRVKADLKKDELIGVGDSCYMVIQTLTGQNKLTLLSFSE